jgi:hypothetical protein
MFFFTEPPLEQFMDSNQIFEVFCVTEVDSITNNFFE